MVIFFLMLFILLVSMFYGITFHIILFRIILGILLVHELIFILIRLQKMPFGLAFFLNDIKRICYQRSYQIIMSLVGFKILKYFDKLFFLYPKNIPKFIPIYRIKTNWKNYLFYLVFSYRFKIITKIGKIILGFCKITFLTTILVEEYFYGGLHYTYFCFPLLLLPLGYRICQFGLYEHYYHESFEKVFQLKDSTCVSTKSIVKAKAKPIFGSNPISLDRYVILSMGNLDVKFKIKHNLINNSKEQKKSKIKLFFRKKKFYFLKSYHQYCYCAYQLCEFFDLYLYDCYWNKKVFIPIIKIIFWTVLLYKSMYF